MTRRTRRSSATNQPPSASTLEEQAAANSVSNQSSAPFPWLVCPSPLCGTRWAESPRRKPGSRCGDTNRGWFGDCQGRLATVSGRAAQ